MGLGRVGLLVFLALVLGGGVEGKGEKESGKPFVNFVLLGATGKKRGGVGGVGISEISDFLFAGLGAHIPSGRFVGEVLVEGLVCLTSA
eukprot:468976-Amorphochlora_amoeboformis.AAC.1